MRTIKEFCGVDSFNKKPNGEEMSHKEMYELVVQEIGLEVCKRYIPATKAEIQEALKTDKYLNNIPLRKWDLVSGGLYAEMRRHGLSASLSECVSTLKAAARLWAEEEEA